MQVRGMTTHSGVCASSPCVTVAVRAEPHDPVFVGNSEAVKGVRSHHQEEVKHLKEEKKKSLGMCVINGVRYTQRKMNASYL